MKYSRFRRVLIDWLVYSIVCSPMILAGILYAKTEYTGSLLEFLSLLRGNAGTVNKLDFTISVLPLIFTLVVTIRIPHRLFSYIIWFIFGSVPKPKHADNHLSLLREISEIILFSSIEELIFRGGFLWLMPLIFKGPGAFYVLFLSSSIFFAFFHFFNPGASVSIFSRSIYTIGFLIPGLFLGFVFMKFGIIAVCIMHVLCNMIEMFVQRIDQFIFKRNKNIDLAVLSTSQ